MKKGNEVREGDTITILKSLADETRLSIVRHLATVSGEVMGSEIVGDCSVALHLSQPAMSHHFHKLVTAGVVQERKEGTMKYYRLNRVLLRDHGINVKKLSL